MKNVVKKGLLAAIISGAIVSGGMNVASAASFMEEVPVGDWSYQDANTLINSGKVADYEMAIPEGRVLSRMEMAMIVESVNKDALNDAEKTAYEKLNKEYYYDIKKVQMLSRLDSLDDKALEDSKAAETFTPEERESLKKAAAQAEKFTVEGGFARLRFDHFLSNKGNAGAKGDKTNRSTRADMINVQVNTKYKVNENWDVHTDVTLRRSFSNPTKTATFDPGESGSGMLFDVYATGKYDNLDIKLGKWNEWNIYGWGMDIDCDFTGFQVTAGNKLKTTFTQGRMDLWDYAMYYNDTNTGDRETEEVTSLRWFYPFDEKNDVNFGFSWSSAMKSRYQDGDGRVFYYYAHGHHKFDNNWDLRGGLIRSNAKPLAGTNRSHSVGQWLQLQYKNADIQKPGSWAITADYRYEPAMTWPTVTDWCGQNEKFFRLGASYVPAKNILLDTFYTWARDIDTDARNDLYRFQAQFFF